MGERSERWGVLASSASVGGVWASEASGGGVPASEASFPPEASQVVAEGDGLRVKHKNLIKNRKHEKGRNLNTLNRTTYLGIY